MTSKIYEYTTTRTITRVLHRKELGRYFTRTVFQFEHVEGTRKISTRDKRIKSALGPGQSGYLVFRSILLNRTIALDQGLLSRCIYIPSQPKTFLVTA